MRFTDAQLRQYDEDGFVIVDCPFASALTDNCLAAVELATIDPELNTTDSKGNHYRLPPQIPGSYWCTLDHCLRFLQIELHDEVVELARQLASRVPSGDEDIYFRNGGINELAPGRSFKWHRDAEEDYVEFMHYFSGARQSDGCLRVVPGSHLGSAEPWMEQVYASRSSAPGDAASVHEDDVELPEEVSLEIGKEKLLIRSSRLLHATWVNRSPRGRLMHHWLFRESTAANHRFHFEKYLSTPAIEGLTEQQQEVLWLGRDFPLDPKWDGERERELGQVSWSV